MIIGQVLHSEGGQTFDYYSPWQPAGGNLAVMSCEVIVTNGLTSILVTVQTKNSEQSDKDAAVPAGGSANSIALGSEVVTKFDVGAKLSSTTDLGFKELFRFKYQVVGDDQDPGFVHMRMLDPAWLTN